MSENDKFGLVNWVDFDVSKAQKAASRPERGTSKFIRLQPGENAVRIITSPFLYMSHRYKEDGDKGIGDRVGCSSFHGSCHLCDMVDAEGKPTCKAQPRWYVGVIDRRSGAYKILDMGSSVFQSIQKYSRKTEQWGDPSGYDICIEVDKQAAPANYYTVMPLGKSPLTEADLEIKKKDVDLDYLRQLCTPPTSEQLKERLKKIASFKARKAAQGQGGQAKATGASTSTAATAAPVAPAAPVDMPAGGDDDEEFTFPQATV